MYSGYLDYSNIEQFSFDIVIIPLCYYCVCVFHKYFICIFLLT